MNPAAPDHLDQPERIHEIRAAILRNPLLRRFYEQTYRAYGEVLARCPPEGDAVELGAGGGFVKDLLPEVLTSDMLAYEGIDRVVDATKMPFEAGTLRALVMLNVLHHIPDAEAFFTEAIRCLRPGGRVFLRDQHRGWISTPILRYLHHEPFRPDASTWSFDSTGPLSGANGALPWIVFRRDISRFRADFPELELVRYEPVSPLRYWLSGGLQTRRPLPEWFNPMVDSLDETLLRVSPDLGSFVDIELVRR